ncbi:Uncharacterized protein Adt_32408 [Abeliophyllum distichum]|uniref:Uncharacterized protein n=1 Tax=Abeliophyllum distichum TaxID=126358 RepID=A0ABD1QTB4_9LAMI
MGCGASRFDANGVESPTRLHPFILHSIEDDSASKDQPLINDAQKSMSVEASDKERLEGKNSEDQVEIELDELTDGEFEDVEEEDYDKRVKKTHKSQILRLKGDVWTKLRIEIN